MSVGVRTRATRDERNLHVHGLTIVTDVAQGSQTNFHVHTPSEFQLISMHSFSNESWRNLGQLLSQIFVSCLL